MGRLTKFTSTLLTVSIALGTLNGIVEAFSIPNPSSRVDIELVQCPFSQQALVLPLLSAPWLKRFCAQGRAIRHTWGQTKAQAYPTGEWSAAQLEKVREQIRLEDHRGYSLTYVPGEEFVVNSHRDSFKPLRYLTIALHFSIHNFYPFHFIEKPTRFVVIPDGNLVSSSNSAAASPAVTLRVKGEPVVALRSSTVTALLRREPWAMAVLAHECRHAGRNPPFTYAEYIFEEAVALTWGDLATWAHALERLLKSGLPLEAAIQHLFPESDHTALSELMRDILRRLDFTEGNLYVPEEAAELFVLFLHEHLSEDYVHTLLKAKAQASPGPGALLPLTERSLEMIKTHFQQWEMAMNELGTSIENINTWIETFHKGLPSKAVSKSVSVKNLQSRLDRHRNTFEGIAVKGFIKLNSAIQSSDKLSPKLLGQIRKHERFVETQVPLYVVTVRSMLTELETLVKDKKHPRTSEWLAFLRSQLNYFERMILRLAGRDGQEETKGVQKPVDVDVFLQRLIPFYSDGPLANQVKVHFFSERNLPKVLIDERQLFESVDNLMRNAFDAAERLNSGKQDVWIRASAKEGRVLLDITNEGQGIPTDELLKVFRRGYTTKTDTKFPHGFGLWRTHVIMESVHGKIEISTRYIPPNSGKTKSKKGLPPAQYALVNGITRVQELEAGDPRDILPGRAYANVRLSLPAVRLDYNSNWENEIQLIEEALEKASSTERQESMPRRSTRKTSLGRGKNILLTAERVPSGRRRGALKQALSKPDDRTLLLNVFREEIGHIVKDWSVRSVGDKAHQASSLPEEMIRASISRATGVRLIDYINLLEELRGRYRHLESKSDLQDDDIRKILELTQILRGSLDQVRTLDAFIWYFRTHSVHAGKNADLVYNEARLNELLLSYLLLRTSARRLATIAHGLGIQESHPEPLSQREQSQNILTDVALHLNQPLGPAWGRIQKPLSDLKLQLSIIQKSYSEYKYPYLYKCFSDRDGKYTTLIQELEDIRAQGDSGDMALRLHMFFDSLSVLMDAERQFHWAEMSTLDRPDNTLEQQTIVSLTKIIFDELGWDVDVEAYYGLSTESRDTTSLVPLNGDDEHGVLIIQGGKHRGHNKDVNTEELVKVDETTGALTGRYILRKKAHAEGGWHAKVDVYVRLPNSRILFQVGDPMHPEWNDNTRKPLTEHFEKSDVKEAAAAGLTIEKYVSLRGLREELGLPSPDPGRLELISNFNEVKQVQLRPERKRDNRERRSILIYNATEAEAKIIARRFNLDEMDSLEAHSPIYLEQRRQAAPAEYAEDVQVLWEPEYIHIWNRLLRNASATTPCVGVLAIMMWLPFHQMALATGAILAGHFVLQSFKLFQPRRETPRTAALRKAA